MREIIAQRVEQLGLDLATVSKKIGRNHSYLHQFLQYEKPRHLGEDDRRELAALLGIPEEKLKGPGKVRATSRPQAGRIVVDPVATNGEPTLFTTTLREIDVSASAGGGAIVEAGRYEIAY